MLDYWLNISALLEYGVLYSDLSAGDQKLCQRFEYLQELDHFSEIMDLSLLTKYVSKEFDGKDKEILKYEQATFLKYLNYNSDNKNFYKPIAGRSKHVNLGLERMLGEAAAKRRNCQFIHYKEAGEYNENYYPMQSTAQTEAQFKVLDFASVGSIRTNYPYIGLLLTSNSPVSIDQNEIKKLSNICINLILQYGLEIGLAMFDGYIFDVKYQQFLLSLQIVQVFKPKKNSKIQIKIMSIGSGAVFVYQNKKIKHITICGGKESDSFVGVFCARHNRQIISVDAHENIKIVLAPYSYGLALKNIPFSQLFHDANLNAQNPLAWIMNLASENFKIPKEARNLLSFLISPSSIEVVSRPKWTNNEIREISDFKLLKETFKAYLKEYKFLEINVLYAHLHADRFVDIHQEISTKIAQNFKNELESSNISFTLHPLIDNLHVRDTFDYKKYNEMLLEQNLEPDVILTEDSLLIDRIGQGILYYIAQQEGNDNYKIIFEGSRAINILYSDNTVVQLIDHMDKDGRLACITFDLAQIYYRQAPNLFENLFKNEIVTDFPNSILAQLYAKNPDKGYHQIMYEEVYLHPDVKYRNELFQKIVKETRPNINTIEDCKPMLHYIESLQQEIKIREQSRSKKVISLYILEGSYDAQFDRYSKVHNAFAIFGIDVFRVSFVSENLNFNVMSIQS